MLRLAPKSPSRRPPLSSNVRRHQSTAAAPRSEPSARPGARHIMSTMPTPSKRPSSSKAKQAPKLQPPAPESSSKPFLRFYHSEALRKKTLSLLGVVEQAQDAAAHRAALADLVVELTNAGLDFYFLKQLKLAKPGFLVEQSASLGMAGAQQVMGSVIRQVIGRMDGLQLLSVCSSIRRLML